MLPSTRFAIVQWLGYLSLVAGVGLGIASTMLPIVEKVWTQTSAILALGLAIGFLVSYVIAKPPEVKAVAPASGVAKEGA